MKSGVGRCRVRPSRPLTANEAAALLGISRRSVYRHAADGLIPSVRIGGVVRFPAAELESWLRKRTRPAAPERPRAAR